MTFRDDWDAASSNTRWFYKNFADRYMSLYGQYYRDPLAWLITLTAMQLATRSQYWKQINSASPDMDFVPIGANQSYPEPPDTLPFDKMLPPGVPDQMWAIPYFFDPIYRPAYNVRKSYWTGISRRRRNL